MNEYQITKKKVWEKEQIGQEKRKDRQSWLDKDDKIIKKRAVTGKAIVSSGI